MKWVSITRYRENKAAKERRRGWDYAAGMLLEDNGSDIVVQELKQRILTAAVFGDVTWFDIGIKAALLQHHINKNL